MLVKTKKPFTYVKDFLAYKIRVVFDKAAIAQQSAPVPISKKSALVSNI